MRYYEPSKLSISHPFAAQAMGDVDVPRSALDLFEDAVVPGRTRALVFGNGEDDADYVKTAGLERADVGDADFVLARGLFATLGAGLCGTHLFNDT